MPISDKDFKGLFGKAHSGVPAGLLVFLKDLHDANSENMARFAQEYKHKVFAMLMGVVCALCRERCFPERGGACPNMYGCILSSNEYAQVDRERMITAVITCIMQGAKNEKPRSVGGL